jgi:hypothetical protein
MGRACSTNDDFFFLCITSVYASLAHDPIITPNIQRDIKYMYQEDILNK